jgi:uncharacterized protein YhjY with autotransporter beta-barrel domain
MNQQIALIALQDKDFLNIYAGAVVGISLINSLYQLASKAASSVS